MWLAVLSLNFGIKSNYRGSKCFIVIVRLMFAFDRDVLLSTCVFPEKLCFPCLIPGDAFLAVSLHFLRRAGDREVQRMGGKWGDTRPALLRGPSLSRRPLSAWCWRQACSRSGPELFVLNLTHLMPHRGSEYCWGRCGLLKDACPFTRRLSSVIKTHTDVTEYEINFIWILKIKLRYFKDLLYGGRKELCILPA